MLSFSSNKGGGGKSLGGVKPLSSKSSGIILVVNDAHTNVKLLFINTSQRYTVHRVFVDSISWHWKSIKD